MGSVLFVALCVDWMLLAAGMPSLTGWILDRFGL